MIFFRKTAFSASQASIRKTFTIICKLQMRFTEDTDI